MRSSSLAADLSSTIMPLRSNCHATAPGSASEPPLRLKMFLISEPVRLRLSVRHLDEHRDAVRARSPRT